MQAAFAIKSQKLWNTYSLGQAFFPVPSIPKERKDGITYAVALESAILSPGPWVELREIFFT